MYQNGFESASESKEQDSAALNTQGFGRRARGVKERRAPAENMIKDPDGPARKWISDTRNATPFASITPKSFE